MRYFTWKLELALDILWVIAAFVYFSTKSWFSISNTCNYFYIEDSSDCKGISLFDGVYYRPKLFKENDENACFIRWHFMLSLVFVIIIHIILHIIRSYTRLKVTFVLSHCVKSVQIRNLSGPYLPVCSLDTRKYGPEKLLSWALFKQFLLWLSRVLESVLLDCLNYINKSFFYQMKWIHEFVNAIVSAR